MPSEPYLLTVALNLGRMNIEVVLEALRQMHVDGKPVPPLVIAGSYRKRLHRYISWPIVLGIQDKIVFIDNPNQTDLLKLYKGALALVMPSKLEGWGLPAGEALWCGTPVICSTAEALQEVCGNVGLYFPPDDAAMHADIIGLVMNDHDFRLGVAQQIGKAQHGLRTWRAAAQDALDAVKAPNPE